MIRRTILGFAAMIGVACSASPACADVSARYEFDRELRSFSMEMTVEIDGNGDMRVQTKGQPNYMLVLKGTAYLISRGPTGISVVRVDDLATVLGEASSRMGFDKEFAKAPAADTDPPMKLVAMGNRVVNGRTGTAYGLSEGDEVPKFAMFVISTDPKLAPLGLAFADSFDRSAQMGNKMMPGFGRLMGNFLPEPQILKQGAPLSMLGMSLTDVSYDEIAPDRFVLPADPLTVEQLRSQYQDFPAPPSLPQRKAA